MRQMWCRGYFRDQAGRVGCGGRCDLRREILFDESAITGESIPVLKQEGDKVISASINKAGLIRARATRVGKDTTIAQIISLVEEASSSKAPIARLADKIAGIFVPTVIGIAIVTFILWLASGADFEFAMSCGIAVLVISCPCALDLQHRWQSWLEPERVRKTVS